ncbi:uncharacterized protein B0I36DRAFT_400961 [Microdochium trichocladiopsis]|uniref:CHAT domain-containing protein n=1 Tax=Microdochium trichocladiopsis TaxID=1682393 RepID=A0A9P8XQK9_9PEZI|nr:uncharacterized protein B0I36DRAFT_400961 [Microdochium trichocladiopsis]KAH7010887.1 hypothetical protein B0I36DRAFT_400961 [Microdochium trichocladiopsis]
MSDNVRVIRSPWSTTSGNAVVREVTPNPTLVYRFLRDSAVKFRVDVGSRYGTVDWKVSFATPKIGAGYAIGEVHSSGWREEAHFLTSYYHCFPVQPTMASRIPVGVLGKLRYERNHVWSLEVGQFLGAYELLYNNPNDASNPTVVAQRKQVTNEINDRLAENRIFYRIPEIAAPVATVVSNVAQRKQVTNEINDRLAENRIFYRIPEIAAPVATVVSNVLDNVWALASAEHCAFALIAEAAFFLSEGMRIAQDEFKPQIKATAKNRLREIDVRCEGIELDSDTFWEILQEQPLQALGTQGLQHLFLAMQRPVSVLILAASPQDQPQLQLGTERRELKESLQQTRFRDAFEIHDVPSCRIRDITQALNQFNPTILHFSGHGNEDGIYFENDQGLSQLVLPKALAGVFEHHTGLKLVILNACFAASQAQVIADKVGHVIAMENEILDRDAISFSRYLYSSLGFGRSIEDAYGEAARTMALDTSSTLESRLLKAHCDDPTNRSQDRARDKGRSCTRDDTHQVK